MCPVRDAGSSVCHANTSLMTSSCRTAVSMYIGSMQEVSLFTLLTKAKRPFEQRKGVSCVVRDPSSVVDIAELVRTVKNAESGSCHL